MALMFPLLVLFNPQSTGYLGVMLVWVGIVAANTSGAVAPFAMLGDVIDYDTLKSGQSRSAQYYSILTLAMKGVGAVGGGIGFYMLKLFHYDAASKSHDAASVFGIKLVVVWIPLILLFIAAATIWFFPIDERRQRIIKRRIESRANRAEREQVQSAGDTPGQNEKEA